MPFGYVGMRKKSFSAYDIEEYLREAGAQKVNEKAVDRLRNELEITMKDIISEAHFYANYAGRKKLITSSDIEIAKSHKTRNARLSFAFVKGNSRKTH
jgi:histone H3/H4